jgi:hypothetical protein
LKHVSWVLVLLLLVGCSFVTTSREPLFTATDFVVPLGSGTYSTAGGMRMDVRTSGRSLLLRVTESDGKVTEMTGGAVATRFPGYFLVQLSETGSAASFSAYIPAEIADGEVRLLIDGGADDRCDEVFLRHGFRKDDLGWSHPEPFTRPSLLAFYDDLLAVVTRDTRWSRHVDAGPYKGIIFRKDDTE